MVSVNCGLLEGNLLVHFFVQRTNGGKAYHDLKEISNSDWRQIGLRSLPEGHEKAKPSKGEYTSVHVEGVQSWNGARLAVDWIDHRGPP